MVHLNQVLHDEIARNGYSLGRTVAVDVHTGEERTVINATTPDGSQSWTVTAHDETAALCELARQLGFTWDE